MRKEVEVTKWNLKSLQVSDLNKITRYNLKTRLDTEEENISDL